MSAIPLCARATSTGAPCVIMRTIDEGVAMKRNGPTDPDRTMDEMMSRWPSTVAVVLSYRMLCVGCPIAGFHTIEDACREHDVDLDAFVADIENAAAMAG